MRRPIPSYCSVNPVRICKTSCSSDIGDPTFVNWSKMTFMAWQYADIEENWSRRVLVNLLFRSIIRVALLS
ncbi:hypothetical protein HanIR_Chr10g0459881 [Helianthus annuus]|nr:hypothetical protein HanIR_Chr10g0459881 [Helianthus annuus]